LAYIADWSSGLQIVNISNPSAPTFVGSYGTPGNARDVEIVGNLAYIADDWSGLRIVNISNPSAPTLVGSYDTPGFAEDVEIVGNYAYIADGGGWLQIVNISNPSAPTLVGSYDTPGYARDVEIVGNYAYIADDTSLQIVNISNPANPTLVGSFTTRRSAREVEIVGNLAYVVGYPSEIEVIDISNPSSPTAKEYYGTPSYAYDVEVVGNLLYVADNLGLSIFDVYNSTPLPSLSINDVSITEGNSGTKTLTFTVTRTGTPTGAITVNYATADNTATTANNDYVATSGTLNFATTDVTKTISVTINGDTNIEPNETFLVNLTNATNATIADSQGVGTIINDDQPPGPKQIITPNPINYSVAPGGTVSVKVDYSTSDNDNTLSAFGFRLHYNSNDLTFNNFSNLFTTGLLAQGSPEADTGNFDNDPTTDKFINVAWADFGGNWPNQTLPLRLYHANFTASANFEGDTLINFSSNNTAAGYGFESTAAVITEAPPVNMDADGNGVAQGSTDGILIARYLFGFTGNALINGVVAPNATRTTAEDIANYLQLGVSTMLDADGNGTAQGSTDGILIARYLFGFTGSALINGVVAPNATRTTAEEIEGFLGSFVV
jgi:hypothetical protein